MTDACIIVFKADVSLDQCGGAFHRTDTSSHVAIADVVCNSRRNLAVFCTSDSYACITDVMDDVVGYGTVFTNLNSRRAGLTDVFVALHVALRGVVLFPFCIVVTPNAGHCEAIKRGSPRHAYSGAFAFWMIEDGLFGPPKACLPLRVVACALHGHTCPQDKAFPVGSLQDQDSVAGFGILNCGLYGGVFFGDQQVCSPCRRRKRKEGCKDCRPRAL